MMPGTYKSAGSFGSRQLGQLGVYQHYKRLSGIDQTPQLGAFEELVARTSLYDLIEYSHKYSKIGDAYKINAKRVSLFKYDFNIRTGLPLLHAGLRAFNSIATNDAAIIAVPSLFRMPVAGLCQKEVCFVAIGVDLSAVAEESVLKIYVSYRSDDRDRYPTICRNSITLLGVASRTQYRELSLREALAMELLNGFPESLRCSANVSRVFLQQDKVHFELHRIPVESISRLIHDVAGEVKGLADRLYTMASSGFEVIIVSFDRAAVSSGSGSTEFTMYFRHARYMVPRR